MRKIARISVLFSVLLALAGCNIAGTFKAKGYFYVTSKEDGYIVALDTDPQAILFENTQEVSKSLSLPDAQKLCDQLNRDLGSNANIKK